MSYIITKRTECEKCHGAQQYMYSKVDPDVKFALHCHACEGKGFTDTYHDFDEVLLSRLAKLRWNPRFTDNGTEWNEFDGMEIQDDTTV